jgi:hypothetical protein
METQQILQVNQARIHKDYQPSVGMCEFGTSTMSLAASERASEINQKILSKRSLDRHLGKPYTSGYSGDDADHETRLKQFTTVYCNPRDNGNGLGALCGTGGSDKSRLNRDIDYVSAVDYPWTITMNLNDTQLTRNEEDVLALSANLFGSNVLRRPSAGSLDAGSGRAMSTMQRNYLDMRSLVAKRNVAQNSFNAITSMKTTGTSGSREYMISILSELGIQSADEIKMMLGDDPTDPVKKQVEPSYYAQMEVLTKKIFQNPNFYKELYDTPANIDRKAVALQAIGLMQKFDTFKSYLRHEATVSVLLETAIMEMQDEIENKLNQQNFQGEPVR